MTVDAFDGIVPKDNDPITESADLGVTLGATPDFYRVPQDVLQPIVAVYREAIRDASEERGWMGTPVSVLENTVAHEVICHAFSIGHVTNTLCNPTHLEGATGVSFPGELIAKLRARPRPMLNPN
jgi:hypothetical protein